MGKTSPIPFLPHDFKFYSIIFFPTISTAKKDLTNQECLHEHLQGARCLRRIEQSNVRSLRRASGVPVFSLSSSLPPLTAPRHASFPSLSAWPLKTRGVEDLLDSLAHATAHPHGAGGDRSSGAGRSVLEIREKCLAVGSEGGFGFCCWLSIDLKNYVSGMNYLHINY